MTRKSIICRTAVGTAACAALAGGALTIGGAFGTGLDAAQADTPAAVDAAAPAEAGADESVGTLPEVRFANVPRDEMEIPEDEGAALTAPDDTVLEAAVTMLGSEHVAIEGALTSQEPATVTVTGGENEGTYRTYLLPGAVSEQPDSVSIIFVDESTGALPEEVEQQLTAPGSRLATFAYDLEGTGQDDTGLEQEIQRQTSTHNGGLTSPESLATLNCDSGIDTVSADPVRCAMSPEGLYEFDVTVVPVTYSDLGRTDALVVFDYTP